MVVPPMLSRTRNKALNDVFQRYSSRLNLNQKSFFFFDKRIIQRSLQTSPRRWQKGSEKCSVPDCPNGEPPASPVKDKPSLTPSQLKNQPAGFTHSDPYFSSLPLTLRRLAANLPTALAGKRPTRDEVLALTTSFFERLKIRFKWATIRSYRHFRLDDYSAFFSMGIVGTLGWFLIGTTSFLSFVFFIINSLSLQEWVAFKLGEYVTSSTGVNVVFESAIVPHWGFFGDGSKIVFKNVYVSRGAATGRLGVLPATPPASYYYQHQQQRIMAEGKTEEDIEYEQTVAKWTNFHLTIDTVEIQLSLRRWLDGKGIIREAAVKGIRGIIDRSHIEYDPNAPVDKYAYRNKPKPGDFQLEGMEIDDFLVTIYQPDNFRPYTFSIFHADLKRLRKNWLFYDFMSAESITGQVDNCLFSLHRPQSVGRTIEYLKDEKWSRMSRFRIDGVPIDHMQAKGDTGVLSWVTSGRCDIVADISFPRGEEEEEFDLSSIIGDLVEKLDSPRIPGRNTLSKDALEVPEGWHSSSAGQSNTSEHEVAKPFKNRKVHFDFDIRFKDMKANVPFFTSNLSYINNALVRPIVAFINNNKTLIPVHCQFDLTLDDFDGSWTTYDVGILSLISEQTYAALAHHVESDMNQRIQTVSLWTLQMTANAILNTFKTNMALH